jgi:hypothetical protein
MKSLITTLLCALFAVSTAYAAEKGDAKPAVEKQAKDVKKEPSAAQKQQQERMKSCNKDAGEKKLKGEERKKFMSSCLKGESSAKNTPQQDKMKSCNKEAADKKLAGDERKKFMSTCLKG